jgi:hypothetical protein
MSSFEEVKQQILEAHAKLTTTAGYLAAATSSLEQSHEAAKGFVFIDFKMIKYDRDRRPAPAVAQDFLTQFNRLYTPTPSGTSAAEQKHLHAYAERYGATEGTGFREAYRRYIEFLRTHG